MNHAELLESIAPQLAAARLACYDTGYKAEYRHRPENQKRNREYQAARWAQKKLKRAT